MKRPVPFYTLLVVVAILLVSAGVLSIQLFRLRVPEQDFSLLQPASPTARKTITVATNTLPQRLRIDPVDTSPPQEVALEPTPPMADTSPTPKPAPTSHMAARTTPEPRHETPPVPATDPFPFMTAENSVTTADVPFEAEIPQPEELLPISPMVVNHVPPSPPNHQEHPQVATVIQHHANPQRIDPALRTFALTTGDRLYLFDKIETDQYSRLLLELMDKSTLSIGPSSLLFLDEYTYTPEENFLTLTLRQARGAIRLLTSSIDNLRRNVNVRTGMATIGIRDCDVGLRTSFEQEDIFIFSSSGKETINMESTKTGLPIRNLQTGRPLKVPDQERQIVDISEPGKHLILRRGIGMSVGPIQPEAERLFNADTEHLPPSDFRMQPGVGGVRFELNRTHAP